MKIYLLIKRCWFFILDSVFPKKSISFQNESIMSIYQRCNILPSSYHTRFLIPYQNSCIKRAIWNFKYYQKETEIKTFSDILSDELIAQLTDNVSTLPLRTPFSLVYPPSTSYMLGTKTFDHMKVLSDMICILQNKDFPFFKAEHGVFKIKEDIKPQHLSSKKERSSLSKDKYILKKEITSHTIICIDDVLTTGNTIKSINRLLKSHRIFNVTLSG
jgi:predicted amidophosphoribosyltransferase